MRKRHHRTMERQKIVLTFSLILTLIPYTVCGAYTGTGSDDGFAYGRYSERICLDGFEVNVKRIIRTEDSLNNKSTFVDAVISDSYENCLRECCKHGVDVCDTTVFIESDAESETKENCFLFRCWFGDNDQRCLFSYHEGYKSSMIGGFEAPRFASQDDTFPVHKDEDDSELMDKSDMVKLQVQMTTVHPPTTKVAEEKQTPKKAEEKQTPKKTSADSLQHDYAIEPQRCISMQYQCPESGECIPERLVCDQYEDCRDKSDEKDCTDSTSAFDDQQPQEQEDKIPVWGSPVTTLPPPPQPTPEDSSVGVTNKVTLSVNPPLLTNPPVVVHHEEHVQEAVVISDELDGVSGAMFPLVVGLLLTFFLLIMVGFRLHYMNRRVRYGRMKTNAHDADYLINGMYL